jgi:hypothetical protein
MTSAVRPRRGISLDKAFILGIFLTFAVVFVLSFSLSRTAGGVPKLISACGMVLCALSFFMKPRIKKAMAQSEAVACVEAGSGLSFVKCLLFIAAYMVSMIVLGFLISTFLMLILFPLLLKYRNMKVAIPFSAITTAILYFTFVKLFYVRLSTGLLIDLIFKAG